MALPEVDREIVVCDGKEAPMLAAETGVKVTLSCCSWWSRRDDDDSDLDERGDFISSLLLIKSDFISLDFEDVGVKEIAAAAAAAAADDDDELSCRIRFES